MPTLVIIIIISHMCTCSTGCEFSDIIPICKHNSYYGYTDNYLQSAIKGTIGPVLIAFQHFCILNYCDRIKVCACTYIEVTHFAIV